MKIKNIIITAAALALTACTGGEKIKVTGQITNAPGKILYLEHDAVGGPVLVDSLKLDNEGRFSLRTDRPSAPDFYRLILDGATISFTADSLTEQLNINSNGGSFASDYQIEGESNQKIKQLGAALEQLRADIQKIQNEITYPGVARDSIINMIQNYKKTVAKKYILDNPSDPAAYYAIYQTLGGLPVFSPSSSKFDKQCYAAVATSMKLKYPESDRTVHLQNLVLKAMKDSRIAEIMHDNTTGTDELTLPAEKVNTTGLIDITLKDQDGKLRSLTGHKGKVVLLDFTVYADKGSIAHNMAMGELYEKYHKRGLDIHQISIDPDVHFWRTQADKLPWTCVRDEAGTNSQNLRTYNIRQIPTIFIIDRSCNIKKRIESGDTKMIAEEIEKLL